MNEVSFDYVKKRKQFNKPFNFTTSSTLLNSIDPSKKEQALWISKISNSIDLDCVTDLSECKVGTEPIDIKNNGMEHNEGGFGKEVNNSKDPTERKRAIDRMKGPNFNKSLLKLVSKVLPIIEQNNSIDLYQDYFNNENIDHSLEPPSLKTMCVLRDPNNIKRSATNICWCPDNSYKLAISYSCLEFQKFTNDLNNTSYIWDINNPNEPETILSSPSPAVSLAYNPKSTDWIVGGLYNGLVAFWDVRKGNTVETSSVEQSHHDPVYDVQWIQSRTNQEFCSISTDGFIKWWDIRKLSTPMDSFSCATSEDGQRQGCLSLEYRTDAGANKFLVGTESGEVLSIERKPKKDASSSIGIKQVFGGDAAHYGPINSVKRNPSNPKYFLSTGGWTSKIWYEDLKQPILLNRFEASHLTTAAWSPTRPGVFFTAKMNGTIDVWDLFYKLNEPVLCTKVGESKLTALSLHSKGKLMAVGSADGHVSILELCDSLAVPQNNEKNTMQQIWDRESKREKHLDQVRSKKQSVFQHRKSEVSSDIPGLYDEDAINATEAEFSKLLNGSNAKIDDAAEESIEN